MCNRRHPGENRGPEGFYVIDTPGFRLSLSGVEFPSGTESGMTAKRIFDFFRDHHDKFVGEKNEKKSCRHDPFSFPGDSRGL
jgi:hypothetical protein